MDTKQAEDQDDRKDRLMLTIRKLNLKEVFTWQLARTLAMGQGLAVLICGTAISSQYLATSFHVNTPMLQSFLNYALLCVTYTSMLLCRTDSEEALVEVPPAWPGGRGGQLYCGESVPVHHPHQYTVLMILSWWALKTRYRPVHYIAVCICLLGVGAMVGADLLAERDQGSTSNILLGDFLVLISATLYAVSNVCQEYTVKNLSRVEFLGMVGLFGLIISTIQMVILERQAMASIQWRWEVGLLLSAYALCMYALYSCMPIVMRLSSATAVNLSLLTADLFSLFSGIFIFSYNFSSLYLVSLVVILIGFITFNAVPTPTSPADPAPSSSSSTWEEVCDDDDDPVATQNDITSHEVITTITIEEEEEEEERRKVASQSLRQGNEDDDGGGRSTKL
ncbi:solute carrier family 35 member F2-like isoform X2 [Antennarius striatus]|uniref:solute carrier family 35 member F2-like isoform X2 n=1 Tax=Antennarius striatus TaxID=241820 RepID=UPI0035B1A6B5